MSSKINPFGSKTELFVASQAKRMTLIDFMQNIKNNPVCVESPAGKLLRAFGEKEMFDTATDPRMSRIFSNRVIARYPAFKNFWGMEDAIEQIASYLKHSEQGLEESKQILYLLGPVGGGKSSLAENLKALMEKAPIYRLVVKVDEDVSDDDKENWLPSPINDHPLCLFDSTEHDLNMLAEYGVTPYQNSKHSTISPWATKRLNEFGGDISKFYVEEIYPSINEQIAIAKTEPGDDNNQDISALVGKVDIRQLEHYAINDPDAYCYSGALNRANQGLMEFVEMFKAPIKVLHPLLTATQEGNYNSTEGTTLPYTGILLAHSNESEWVTFRNNKNNEAFLDRVCTVKVPYCLRVTEEVEIYKKLLAHSTLSDEKVAPDTLECLAQFSVLSRLKDPENSSVYSKMRVYDGESLKDTDPKAKSYQEYRDYAGIDEGMSGMSTRFAFKIISRVMNYDIEEVAANPVHLFYVLEQVIEREQLPKDVTERLLEFIKGYLVPNYIEFIGKEIQMAYLESYSDYGQNIFDHYVTYADFWIQDQEYRDADTGQLFDRHALND
ncbi:MAG: serine protein kinase, partial [Alphaproteobacteria bacterium]